MSAERSRLDHQHSTICHDFVPGLFEFAHSTTDTVRVGAEPCRRAGSLEEAAPGTEVDLDGPYGSLTLHRNVAKPAVLMAGGIGITPFRSIVKDATERRLPHKVTLFYSNRTAGSTAFIGDLERWQSENPNFRLVATITEPDSQPWRHETGMIDAAFLRPRVTDPAGVIYYVAGPPAFVAGMRTALDGIGADPDNIRTEEFAGY